MTGYSIIISQAGDWTTEMITNATKGDLGEGYPDVWLHFGLCLCSDGSFSFATGSGIAPFTPHILSGKMSIGSFGWHLIRVATFGDPLVDDIYSSESWCGRVRYVQYSSNPRTDLTRLLKTRGSMGSLISSSSRIVWWMIISRSVCALSQTRN